MARGPDRRKCLVQQSRNPWPGQGILDLGTYHVWRPCGRTKLLWLSYCICYCDIFAGYATVL